MRGPGVAKSRALSTLLENHRLFLAFLERRVGTKADAEDVLQTAFMKMIQNPAGLRNEERVVPWFYQVLRNALSDHYRRRDAEERALRVAARAAEPFSAPEPDPELEGAVCRCVTSLLRTLKREYAEILRTVDLRGRKIADVAKGAGISAGTARVQLHRARRALRKQLEPTCGTWVRYGCPHCTCRVDGRESRAISQDPWVSDGFAPTCSMASMSRRVTLARASGSTAQARSWRSRKRTETCRFSSPPTRTRACSRGRVRSHHHS